MRNVAQKIQTYVARDQSKQLLNYLKSLVWEAGAIGSHLDWWYHANEIVKITASGKSGIANSCENFSKSVIAEELALTQCYDMFSSKPEMERLVQQWY